MPGNPLIDQGQLNRVKASVVWNDFPALTVTAPFLDKEGVTLRKTSPATTSHGTMTGLVKSPEPYMAVSVIIALLKTQPLSAAYQLQMQANTVLGAGTVYPDVNLGLAPYALLNMSIDDVGELLLNGTTPIWAATCSGYWVTNNDLFN